MRKIIFTLMVMALLVSCNDKQKKEVKEDVKKVEKTVDKTAEKVSDETKKGVKKVSDLFKTYTTKSGKKFVIVQEGDGGSLQTIKITPEGFEYSEPYVLKDIDPVEKIFIADVNKDGFEEIYIETRGAGSGSYANLYGYISHKDISVTPIYIPEISEKDLKGKFKGYQGHDEFYVKDGKLYRKFPVYKEGDSNANPTGGEKVLEYVLKSGEATWQLVVK